MNSSIIFEYITRGRFMKVSAICTDTGIEVSIICPATIALPFAQKIAYKKLQNAKKS